MHELDIFAGLDGQKKKKREEEPSYHQIWRNERAEAVTRENYVGVGHRQKKIKSTL